VRARQLPHTFFLRESWRIIIFNLLLQVSAVLCLLLLISQIKRVRAAASHLISHTATRQDLIFPAPLPEIYGAGKDKSRHTSAAYSPTLRLHTYTHLCSCAKEETLWRLHTRKLATPGAPEN
jgi:hypothetical protein